MSVVDFDDTYDAAFRLPALAAVRQPLLRRGDAANAGRELEVEPELVVRESTAARAASA